MKANENKVIDFLNQNKTKFIIPVYQRNYDWTPAQCKLLLDDIIAVGSNNDIQAHFIGSVVYIHDNIYTSSSLKEYNIIDGQQRITTLTLIYLAIYNLYKELNNLEAAEELKDIYLINRYSTEGYKLKLHPTENNKAALEFLYKNDKHATYNEYSNIIYNYEYFKNRIVALNYEAILSGLDKLMFVEIALERGKDDPQRIFESLNSTGLELSQSDLIRNYILMGLNSEQQNNIYNDYWKFIEDHARDIKTNTTKVSDFIRDYLTLKNKSIPTKTKVYEEFKKKFNIITYAQLQKELNELKSLVRFYHKLLNPSSENDTDIKQQLLSIQKLDINVTYPFLMKVYEDFNILIINKEIFINVLNLVQSFVWRRFILNLPSNYLSKIFMNLYEKIEHNNYFNSLAIALMQRTSGQRFPNNAEIIEALKIKDVYNSAKNKIYFFERLENFNNNEPVIIDGNSKITIEHIFPQNPLPQWKKDLTENDYALFQSKYLHSIANLTISGNNSALSNKSFIEKRDMKNSGYRDSRLWLNKYLSQVEKWDIEALEKRYELILERFFKIWIYPEVHLETNNNAINIFDAEDPTHKKIDYVIFQNEKINGTYLSSIYLEILRRLFYMNQKLFFNSDLIDFLEITLNKEKLRHAGELTDGHFIETNLSNSLKFERLKHTLSIFNMEEDLLVKYNEEALLEA